MRFEHWIRRQPTVKEVAEHEITGGIWLVKGANTSPRLLKLSISDDVVKCLDRSRACIWSLLKDSCGSEETKFWPVNVDGLPLDYYEV